MPSTISHAPGFTSPTTEPDLDWSPLERSGDLDDFDQSIQRSNLGAWYETNARIINKSKQLVTPTANALQRRAIDVVLWCLENNVPIRLIMLKPRQKGCSTISMAIVYWMMSNFENYRSVVIGREYSQSANLWKIFRTYDANDEFDWGHERRVLETVCRFGNGATLEQETAEDSEAGRSGTFHAVVATEAARWREGGVAGAEEVLNGLLNCVPYLPGTLIIEESTAHGASGPFYETWCDALDFDEYKRRFERGESMDGRMIRVFAGWYEFEDSCDPLTPEQEAWLTDQMTPDEVDMMARLPITAGHIAWRRRTIRTECQRDAKKFDREFPETPEHAFRASAPSRFHGTGLTMLKAQARQERERWGTLEAQGRPKPGHRLFSFVESEDYSPAARVIMIEPPTVGMRYILSVDPMSGVADDPKGENRDHHAATVIRAGYYDKTRGWRPPKIVARTVLATEKGIKCQWDIDILEEVVWRLSCFYGFCLIVVESNKDSGLIRSLHQRGAHLYESESTDRHGDAVLAKPSGKLGFLTTGGAAENTRSWIIETMARAIREWDQVGEGFEADRRTIKEMENFIVHPDGKAAAITGEHDDSVLAACIGLALIGLATTMTPYISRVPIPADLLPFEKEGRRKTKGQYR